MTKAIKVFSEECKTSPGLALAFQNVSNENKKLRDQNEQLRAEVNRLNGKIEVFKELIEGE
jgi:cell division protein FtsB